MKTTKAQFNYFKKRFKYWQDKFELNNWKVYFTHSDEDGKGYAGADRNGSQYVATVYFCKDWDNSIRPINNREINKTARHEVIHILLGRLSYYGNSRDVKIQDLNEAEEELTRKIETIIDNKEI